MADGSYEFRRTDRGRPQHSQADRRRKGRGRPRRFVAGSAECDRTRYRRTREPGGPRSAEVTTGAAKSCRSAKRSGQLAGCGAVSQRSASHDILWRPGCSSPLSNGQQSGCSIDAAGAGSIRRERNKPTVGQNR